jgi:proteic killer suppression protein
MIRSFRHKGLRRLYENDEARGLPAEHVLKLKDILALLEAAQSPSDLDLPGLRLHPLKGDMRGFHAVTVRANWRVIFRFEGGDVYEVDYLDYH